MENFKDTKIFNVYLVVQNQLKILLPFVSKHNTEKKVFHSFGTTKIIKCIIGSRVVSHKKKIALVSVGIFYLLVWCFQLFHKPAAEILMGYVNGPAQSRNYKNEYRTRSQLFTP